MYVLPMKKHEFELVTSTHTMSFHVLLHECTRHICMRKSKPINDDNRRNDVITIMTDGRLGSHGLSDFSRSSQVSSHVRNRNGCRRNESELVLVKR
jgi:hypothetical protein